MVARQEGPLQAATSSGSNRTDPEKRYHPGNKRGRGRAPRILGPTSARHFSLLAFAFIPSTATAHPIEFLPRQPWRTSAGPPVLHGFPPAPTNHRFSSSLPSGTTHPSWETQQFQLHQMFETDFRCIPFFPTPNQTPPLFLQSPLQAWGYGTSSPTTVPSALATAATSNLSRFSRANSSAFTCTTPLRRPSALSQPRRS